MIDDVYQCVYDCVDVLYVTCQQSSLLAGIQLSTVVLCSRLRHSLPQLLVVTSTTS